MRPRTAALPVESPRIPYGSVERRSGRMVGALPYGSDSIAYILPECRLKICDIFCENADRAMTMSQPASCAACFNSPCICER